MLDLIIRGDTVITAGGVGAHEIAIAGTKIVDVKPLGTWLDTDAHTVIDATGKIVIPGGIDPHVHCKWKTPAGSVSAAPPQVSRAALFGGTTTLIDFAVWDQGMTVEAAIERRDADWRGQSHCDYSYHVILHGEVPPEVVEQLPETISAGFPSVKMYTTDVRPKRAGWKMLHGDIWEVLQTLARCGGIACIHAEDDDLVMHMYRKLFREGRAHFTNMAEVHSTLSEDLSFRRIIRLAENVEGAALYLMHVSAATGLDAIRESRSAGHPIYGETLHQYALFTSDDYHRPNGQIYHTYPSLKGRLDTAALWEGITTNGAISTVSTDGVCTSFSVKVAGEQIDDTTGGSVGVEPRLSIMYTEMVAKKSCTLARFADVVSTNAARIMGLYPRKGVIAPGSDADIAILDPTIKRKIRNEDLHESDYSPWEGYEVQAWPSMTILRGKKVVEDGRFFGDVSDGKRIPRKISSAIFAGPAC
jgi:dihydropyrimidinase